MILSSRTRSAWLRPGQSQDFHELMRRRVENILLVSSPYDSFLLEEDGQLNERMVGEFLDLNLRYAPGLKRVSTGAEAMTLLLEDRRFNLVVATVHVGDMNAAELAREIKTKALDIPVVLLAFDNRELAWFRSRNDLAGIEGVFLWQGDFRIMLSIVKFIEDKLNAPYDCGVAGVPMVLVVEDSVRYYSSFLPTILSELFHHSQNLMAEGLNTSQKLLRLRARPKLLLAHSFEQAWEYFTAYQDVVLGIISDIEFPTGGAVSPESGFELARQVWAAAPDVPFVLQSSRHDNEILARSMGIPFLLKGSPVLLNELRRLMLDYFSFGDFVFRMPDGREVARAHDMRTLEEQLLRVPAASIAYHAERHHFSKWLKARTEFVLAHRLRPRIVSDYPDIEDLRADLVRALATYREELRQDVVIDFDRESFDGAAGFYRLGGGSLGGKARGLAFVRRLLAEYQLDQEFPNVRTAVPSAVVVGTDVFDQFLKENDLADFAIHVADDVELRHHFAAARFPESATRDLTHFLEKVHWPLAVRSSSLLEDSQYQPFTGVYETFMLPNCHKDTAVRLNQLISAIKAVYASTFSQHSKNYIKATPFRLEEEKMAVVLMKLVGTRHSDRFYPDLAGVARSFNFYPSHPAQSEDGIVAVALGLGRTVVEGGNCLRFSPRYPRHLIQFSSVNDILDNSQRQFWALPLHIGHLDMDPEHELREVRYGLDAAETDGTLHHVGSVYSPENEAVFDGLSRQGVRLVSFAPILKHGLFPLAGLVDRLLTIGREGMGGPVEIEFAVSLSRDRNQPHTFGFLQLRPLAMSRERDVLEITEVDPDRLLCRSSHVLGNGRLLDIRDLVVVDYHRFDRSRSHEAALEVAQFNAELVSQGVPYILLGVGRWGSSDPWLGIPVAWDQISGARVIVEAGFKDFRVTPSQGSHFFQNLTAFQVGYFTCNPQLGDGIVDWDWLSSLSATREGTFARHIRLPLPVVVTMNGQKRQGTIIKPD